MKKIINLIFLICLLFSQAGCAHKSIFSQADATPNGSHSKYKKTEPSEGYNNLLSGIGLAILFGTIFKSAPKEAYR